MSYRDVNIEELHQEIDIFRWQGMSHSLAYLSAQRNAIDSYRHWEKLVGLEENMGIYGVAVDEETVIAKVHEGDIVQKVYDILDGKELAMVTETYLHGEKLKDMGKRFGVGEARACQIRTRGIQKIRRRLGIHTKR